jgi:hypothetical protein
MYQVVEYFSFNPLATAMQAIGYFEKEMNITQNLQHIANEVRLVTSARIDLRPLQGQKRDIIENMAYLTGDLAVEVELKYPPRQGTKEQRDKYLEELKAASVPYQTNVQYLSGVQEKMVVLEDQLYEAETNAKNARRVVELFEAYVKFVTQFRKN